MRRLEAIARGYRGVAIFWLNTCVVFLLANLLALLALHVAGRGRDPATPAPVDPKPFRRFFPAMSDADLTEFLRENARAIQYEPFTQLREKPFTGRYVNVRDEGFRSSRNQGPWPPDAANANVFLFGGSTTFGYGVPDDDTIASYLQARLDGRGARPTRVYNFGRGAYYSTQEGILFARLMSKGFVPDVAVFLDGLNDFFFKDDVPVLTGWLQQLVDAHGRETPDPYRTVLATLPLAQLLGVDVRPATTQGYPAAPSASKAPVPFDDDATLSAVLDRYLANRRLVESAGREFGVTTVFVWQPVPTYHYDLGRHPPPAFGQHEFSRYGYPKMEARYRSGSLGSNFVWCADAHDGLAEPAYVDQVHYSPAMSDRVAGCIADALRERRLIP